MVVDARRVEAVSRGSENLMKTVSLLRVNSVISSDNEMVWELHEHMALCGFCTGAPQSGSGFVDMRYWRLSSPTGRSLFSFDIDGGTGIIVAFEMTIYEGTLCEQPPATFDAAMTAGLLVAEVSAWAPTNDTTNRWRFLENEGYFMLQLGDSLLRIVFVECAPARVVKSGPVSFELNFADEVSAVRIENVSEATRARLVARYGLKASTVGTVEAEVRLPRGLSPTSMSSRLRTLTAVPLARRSQRA